MHKLMIHHVPDSDPPQFCVLREDHKSSEPVAVVPPAGFPVQGQPNSDLLQEMQWYLEEFLDYPFHPRTDRADAAKKALETWGRQAFDNLFGDRKGGRFFDKATEKGYEKLHLQIISDDPQILQWPWEALNDPEAAYLSVTSQVERRLNNVRDPLELPEELPRDKINILLVTARPKKRDVGFRSISRPLVELIDKNNIPAHVHVLRPPTFANLRDHLKQRKHFYHIIHFDGHGGYGVHQTTGSDQHKYAGPEGVLLFETDSGEEDKIKADQLSSLLRDQAVPVMVLNACQSAMLDQNADDPFASVAASLIKAGICGVTAMSYSLYVSAAQQFLPEFYKELFNTGDLSRATLAGRQKLYENQKRVCARGLFELKDFMVPVIYQQEPYILPFTDGQPAGEEAKKAALPDEAIEKNPYGFIGRDSEILKLERAMRKDTPAILIQGLGGVGKSTLARGFVKWLTDTEGMEGCIWQTFIDVRSAEFVINGIGTGIFGKDFIVAKMDQKTNALADFLKKHKLVIVWDNFEVAAGIEGTHITPNLTQDDRNLLLSLLEKIRGGKTKVIITSRSEEDWLGIERLKVSIGGLIGEERWEYCEKILDNLGLKVNREDSGQADLMNLLNGHPLSMRAILPKMEKMSAGQIAKAIKTNMKEFGYDDATYATLRFVEDDLPDDLKPLLVPLGLHELHLDADMFQAMTKQVDDKFTDDKIDSFCRALSIAGLMSNLTGPIYELHPALSGFLRSTCLVSLPQKDYDKCSRAFVEVMGVLADQLAPLELHEQRIGFYCHSANFHFALGESERLEMDLYLAALTQSMAVYALNTRNFTEAIRLYEHLAQTRQEKDDHEGEATAYHQMGIVAKEQQDFKMAEKWYLKSLAIKEKQGNERGAAKTYHQLGFIAYEQRNYKHAMKWFLHSIEIGEKLENIQEIAKSLHLIGSIYLELNDLISAEVFYCESLSISIKSNDTYTLPMTYHQLGMLAQELRDFKTAVKWYLKSLEINEKQGNEHGAASTYHQLGRIAEEQHDFKAAEKWYLKSLAIEEKQGNEYGAATTYGQLGIISTRQGNSIECGIWLIKSINIYMKYKDEFETKRNISNFMISYKNATPEDQAKLKVMWEEANIGPFPDMKEE
ncbi:MAG: tetratricopeptide repeat protein [candidate division Zixibacteria bacterium]|nr:tetratricopeptide repeat protein [candidate division Zixibacteria bacterium]